MPRSTFSIQTFLVIFIIIASSSSTVRSQNNDNPLLLPSDRGDICGREEAVPDTCPVKCFRTDPVCGVDGVTYWCGCRDALCAGTQVVKRGFCEASDGINGSVSSQALILVQIVWLILLGFFVLFGLL